ncbi:MAG: hypothetical protein K2P68_10975 [Sphingomonas sp.]|nr:hypothetical protein [Sphingomonas sp.]
MRISPLNGAQRLFFMAGLLLTWPLILNGGPFLFSDTTSYIRAADAVAFSATGHTTPWSDVITTPQRAAASGVLTGSVAGPEGGAGGDPIGDETASGQNVIVGRSIFYGAMLYAGVLFGSLAFPAILQALVAGIAIIGGVRHFADPAVERDQFNRLAIGSTAVAATVSALPWFTIFLMPDVFAGLAILAAAIVLGGWAREPLSWRLFWAALLCFAALVHASHLLLLIALGFVGIGIRALCGPIVRIMPILLVFAAAMIGVAGDAAFQLGIGAVSHRAAVRPPFLAMRLIADGPGAAYLRATCPNSGFALCDFRELPASNSDVLLWSADPRLGMFTAASAEVQRRIAREQFQFVMGVGMRYPGWTAATMFSNFWRQLGLVGLDEFRVSPLADPEVAARTPAPVRATIEASAIARGGIPTGLYRLVIWPVTVIGLGLLALAVFRRGWVVATPALVILIGILTNAAICGALSIPSDRYQDRVIWLIAVFAVFVWRDAQPRRLFNYLGS